MPGCWNIVSHILSEYLFLAKVKPTYKYPTKGVLGGGFAVKVKVVLV